MEPIATSGQRIDAEAVSQYQNEIRDYLADVAHGHGWDWFMYHSHGFAGNSMVLIKLLPELDSSIWGPPSEKFSSFGHFVLPGDENRVLPSSLGMSSFPVADQPRSNLILTTETCGTCHMGRIRIPGSGGDDIVYLYGGANTQVDLRKWRTALESTVAKYLHSESAVHGTAQRLRTLIAEKPPGFFSSDQTEDARQRHLFVAEGSTEEILADFIKKTSEFTEGKKKQKLTQYATTDGRHPPDLNEGNPGHLDASGDILGQRLPTTAGMPPDPSLTDIPTVWRQDERSVGQWDGTVGDAFIRNLAAQVAVVPGPTVDRRVAGFSAAFNHKLPAPKFLFKSNHVENRQALIAKGAKLFSANCADCHRPLNSGFYAQLGTDLNRAHVMGPQGSMRMGQIFAEACSAIVPGGVVSPPCDPEMHKFLRYAGIPENQGYAASPLTGIWARAPYLHNGSVPTLRHFLAPATRPRQFVVGSLGYDAENGGFNWDTQFLDEYQRIDPQARVLDTMQDGLSSKGHDQRDLVLEGKHYRLNWTAEAGDDAESLDALLEYLKTL
jgi:mono/diheme cytochrome c family protein